MSGGVMPQPIRQWMDQRNWGERCQVWHAVRQWDRRTASDQATMEARGWQRACHQQGAPGSGREFLMIHRAMIQVLREKFAGNTALFLGWETPPIDPTDLIDPVPVTSPAPGAFSQTMQNAIARLADDAQLRAFATEDELGLFIESRIRPRPGAPAAFSPDPQAGICAYLQNRFSDPSSSINIGEPLKSLANARWWRLHGWIDERWTAYRRLKELSDTDPQYLADLQQQKTLLSSMGDGRTSAAEVAINAAGRRVAIEPLPAEIRSPFQPTVASRMQELMAEVPVITTRAELVDYLQLAIQIEHATLPLYLTALWSLKDAPNHFADLHTIAMQEMVHFGIVCNLLTAIGATPAIAPPTAVLPSFPGKIPGLDLTAEFPGDISLEPLSTFGADKFARAKLFMRIEQPENPPPLQISLETIIPPFKTIGEFYDVVIQGVRDLAASGAITFDRTWQVSVEFFELPPLEPITNFDQALTQLTLIKEQGEGAVPAGGPITGVYGELPHYYRFKQFVEQREYSVGPAGIVPGPDNSYPFPPASEIYQFAQADNADPRADSFDKAYSKMLDALQAAWNRHPEKFATAKAQMFKLTTLATALISNHAIGPRFHYISQPAPPVALETLVTRGPDLEIAESLRETSAEDTPPAIPGYARIREILDESVQGNDIGAHGPFWRSATRDQFVDLKIFGRPLLAKKPDGTFDPDESNLIKALEGRPPFGSDVEPRPPGAVLRRMPAGFPPVETSKIAEMRAWIAAGAPAIAPASVSAVDEAAPAAMSPEDCVRFWRAFDNVTLFQATRQTQEDVGQVFTVFDVWSAFARCAGKESEWLAAIATPDVAAALRRLELLQRETIQQSFGMPVCLADLLSCWERFGDDSLPEDALRPANPRHRMNGETMWFMWAAFVDAAIRHSASNATIPTDFWIAVSRATLLGCLNDGVFRGRFPVQGFAATLDGKDQMRTFVETLPAPKLGAEFRKRFVESGLG